MFTKYLIFLEAILVTLNAAPMTSDRKCVPEQSEFILDGRIAEVYQGTPVEFVLKGKFSADYVNGMEAIVETVFDAESGSFLANYTQLRMKDATYLIDNVNKGCTKGDGFPVTRICTDTRKYNIYVLSTGLKYIDSWTMGTQMTDTYFYDELTANRKLIMTMFRDSFTHAAAVIDQTFQEGEFLLDHPFYNL
ncbi:uncharacterized protein [Watersipora subatra]|uniref:uncharacterized protein n=1 Tax=Watersipora subatra TaxID=2589382 RepID=UPI00355C8DE3